jgi:hypothetical protein
MDLDHGEQIAQMVEDGIHVPGRMADRSLCRSRNVSTDHEH